ncbi:MAG TPA: hypothetical protein VK169_14495 [Saprospiraceae bacterium]|nr:hypothetical protein [Saprospiraceae bacterium]
MNTPIPPKRLTWLLSSNIILTIVLGIVLLHMLKITQHEYIKDLKKRTIEAEIKKLNTELDSFKIKNDLILVNRLESKIIAKEKVLQESGDGVTFYLIVILMILAGSLGGVLCNLRGFFIQFRKDDGGFPATLEIPYYVRSFLGAGAGLFIYFVSNFLITSITVTYVATNIPFQGMVSFMALAILAGFGSLEFFERLKETALSLFGQKAEKEKWQKIEDLYALMKREVISKEEYVVEKAKILASSTAEEAFIQKRDHQSENQAN